MILHIYTDGGARGNPGPAAIGVVILEEKTGGAEILRNKFGKKIGFATNNVAEYTAVLEALKEVERLVQITPEPVKKIKFSLDSQLVASQLGGIFKVKDPNLQRLFIQIKGKENLLKTMVSYEYVPRAKNNLADREVNLALDSGA